MPKLWRAPMPMVRMVAPQMTGIQKLRCCAISGFPAERCLREMQSNDRQTRPAPSPLVGEGSSAEFVAGKCSTSSETSPNSFLRLLNASFGRRSDTSRHDELRCEALHDLTVLIARFVAHANHPPLGTR